MDYIKILEKIKRKIDLMMEKIDPEKPLEPRHQSVNGIYTDKFETFFRPNWTYSFYMGNVILMYYYTNEKKYLDYLKKAKGPYTDHLFNNEAEIGHDSGFLYSLYAVNMYKITGEKVYRELALKAADEVAKRFRFEPKHIQAFFDMRIRGINDEISLMIVDDMMNMNLIMWAYGETGHSFYRDVYENHLHTAISYLIRDDYSTCHAYHFDVKSGKPVCEMNYCGNEIGSYWSRGTSWIIYGLTKALEFTGSEDRYRYPLEGVLSKYIKSLNGEAVPKWDFRDEDEKSPYDSSAAAIVASAIMEFDKISVNEKLKEKAKKLVEETFRELCSEKYLCSDEKECFIDYGTGEGVLWGDYFFTELIMKLHMGSKLPDMWL